MGYSFTERAANVIKKEVGTNVISQLLVADETGYCVVTMFNDPVSNS